MDKDELRGWLIAISILAIFLGCGWYSSTQNDDSVVSDTYSERASDENGYTFEDYRYRLNEYDEALSEANDHISALNSCSDDVFSALDYGFYEDAYSQFQDCYGNEVSNPGVDL